MRLETIDTLEGLVVDLDLQRSLDLGLGRGDRQRRQAAPKLVELVRIAAALSLKSSERTLSLEASVGMTPFGFQADASAVSNQRKDAD